MGGRLQVILEFLTTWRASAPNLPNCSRANRSHVLLLKTFPSLGFQNPFTWLSFPSLPTKFSSLTNFKILECPWVQSSATFSLYASSSSSCYDLILSQILKYYLDAGKSQMYTSSLQLSPKLQNNLTAIQHLYLGIKQASQRLTRPKTSTWFLLQTCLPVVSISINASSSSWLTPKPSNHPWLFSFAHTISNLATNTVSSILKIYPESYSSSLLHFYNPSPNQHFLPGQF